ncbi:MAG: hypothetical protein ACHQRL_09700, partial [Gemmatimonadales bacterium]
MTRLRQLSGEIRELEARLREGGGIAKTERQHSQGKLTARERVELLRDPFSRCPRPHAIAPRALGSRRTAGGAASSRFLLLALGEPLA